MRVGKTESRSFQNYRDGGERISISRTTWGEPFQEGIRFELINSGHHVTVDLLIGEARDLYECLGKIVRGKSV